MLDSERPDEQRFEDEYYDEEDDALPSSSLFDDVAALVDDGKAYAEAELAFQKSRLAYSAKKGRSAGILGLTTPRPDTARRHIGCYGGSSHWGGNLRKNGGQTFPRHFGRVQG